MRAMLCTAKTAAASRASPVVAAWRHAAIGARPPAAALALACAPGAGVGHHPPCRPAARWVSSEYLHKMYSEPPKVDPVAGKSRWHRLDVSPRMQREKPPRGALEEKEYDEQYGRWWFVRKEHDRPRLYTTIGRHARSKKLNRTIVRFVYSSPNMKKLLDDPYRKRWPKNEQISVRFFAEFCNKPFEKRKLLETAHTLPLFGVGCKFWRGKTADTPDTKGQFFVAESAQFNLRPIRGMMRGTQYYFGRPIKAGVAAIAKTLGSWRFEYPDGAHPAVYRPAFPKMSSADGKAAEE